MHITITDAAAARLSGYSLAPGDRFRLVYDAEGCGCAVSGVASLWLTNAPDPDERQAETNDPAVSIFYLQRQVVFFEERLRLDYAPERSAFRLSSDGQIYGNGIVVIDRRDAPRATAYAPR